MQQKNSGESPLPLTEKKKEKQNSLKKKGDNS